MYTISRRRPRCDNRRGRAAERAAVPWLLMRDGCSSCSSRLPYHISQRCRRREIGRVAFEKWRRSTSCPSLFPQTSQLMKEELDYIAVRLSVSTLKKMHTETPVRREQKKRPGKKCFQPVGMRLHQPASSAGKEGVASVGKERKTIVNS